MQIAEGYFFLARKISHSSHAQTSITHRAPETSTMSFGRGRAYDNSADIWSLGCLLFAQSEQTHRVNANIEIDVYI